jgi:hypothetical protein
VIAQRGPQTGPHRAATAIAIAVCCTLAAGCAADHAGERSIGAVTTTCGEPPTGTMRTKGAAAIRTDWDRMRLA